MSESIFQCPSCSSQVLVYQPEPEALICDGCATAFAIRDGAPRFTLGFSDPGFDQRWRQHPKPQPTDAVQFHAKTGLRPEALQGKTVLDAGCGIGRYCAFITGAGGHAIGVDISPSGLAAARQNAPQARLIEADLQRLPLKTEVVDAAFSIGVLHHTASPQVSFNEVARTVKPGGYLGIWVYTDPVLDPKYRLMVEFLHEITRSCPPEVLYDICRRYAVKIRDTYYPTWGPAEQIMRPAYNPLDEQCISDMFDWHTPKYRSWHSASEVRGWFGDAGFDVTWEGNFPVSMGGVKR